MSRPDASTSTVSVIAGLLDGFGRFMTTVVTVMIDHGPEVLAGLAEIQVGTEYAHLLEQEWAHHPLLDFIKWQDASVGQILAMTMPEHKVQGHAQLAQLLRPACTAPETLVAIERMLDVPGLEDFAVEEFRDGLACVRAGRLDRAVTRLTIGLEGLLRSSAVSRELLSAGEVRSLESGSEVVKRLWPETSGYKAYMKSWVFGLSNPYRHGQDAGAAAAQSLHALCGSAIWAAQLMHDSVPLDHVRAGLNHEVTRQFAAGVLDVQASAEARMRRAAARAERSATVDSLLSLRDQLLDIRSRREHSAAVEPATSPPSTLSPPASV